MEMTPDIGLEAFARARREERARRLELGRVRKAEALVRLHLARDAFLDHDGPDAGADSDGLEILADRLVDWVRSLEPEFDRLGPARDHLGYRGPLLVRRRPPFDAATMAEIMAEAMAEAGLSAHASALLVAAVRFAAS